MAQLLNLSHFVLDELPEDSDAKVMPAKLHHFSHNGIEYSGLYYRGKLAAYDLRENEEQLRQQWKSGKILH